VLGVVGVVLLVLAAVLAEEANAGHRWLVGLFGKVSFIYYIKRNSIFCELPTIN
jgi:hypothetical protein